MRGVRFVTDESGARIAVQLDLEEWGELWEDVYDVMVAEERRGEPSIPLDELEASLRKDGLIED